MCKVQLELQSSEQFLLLIVVMYRALSCTRLRQLWLEGRVSGYLERSMFNASSRMCVVHVT